MRTSTVRAWDWVHRWSSLVCTLFLFILCISGLPLIFHEEIDALSGEHAPVGAASARSGQPLDRIVTAAMADYRRTAGRVGVPLFIGFSQKDPRITVTLGPRADASAAEMRLFTYDRTSGDHLGEQRQDGIMALILRLHVDLFAGLPGMLLLGLMGLLFVLAIVSGLVLYAPFMRLLPFGTLRRGRNRRVGLLDEHNLLGAVTMGWALVIGLTGAINAFADPLTAMWRQGELAAMVAASGHAPATDAAHRASLDQAMAAAQAAQAGLSPQFIGFPGGAWSSNHHYAVFFQGDTPLTSHLLTPALVDVATGKLDAIRPMPVSLQALMLSRPLHFGDYAGLSLKIVWALLDLATIRVLWSGLVLWWGKRRRPAARGAAALLSQSARA